MALLFHPEPADADDELVRLGAALPPRLRLGTSSWSFPGWAGIVYDAPASPGALARHGLRAYAQHPVLRAVGVDRTFYAPLSAGQLAEYASAVPAEFRFLVKAPASCTSPWTDGAASRRTANPSFLEPLRAAEDAVGPFVQGLGPKAGALVFQFVPLGESHTREPARFADRLARFLGDLPRGPVYAVELRDRALLGPDYEQALAATGAVHCINVHPRMPPVAEQRRFACRADSSTVVLRWMLHAGLGYQEALARYEPFSRLVDEDPASRNAIAELCVEQSLSGKDVLVIANNKAEGSAPLTICKLARAIHERLPSSA